MADGEELMAKSGNVADGAGGGHDHRHRHRQRRCNRLALPLPIPLPLPLVPRLSWPPRQHHFHARTSPKAEASQSSPSLSLFPITIAFRRTLTRVQYFQC